MKINALPPGIITLQNIIINTIKGGYAGNMLIMIMHYYGQFITLRYGREDGRENNR